MVKKTKTTDLPGMTGPGVAQPRIKSVDDAAEIYIKERDKRCAMTPREIAAKQKLIEQLHTHADKIGRDRDGTIVYRYDDNIVILKPGKETLQVKETSHGDAEAD